MKLPRVLIGGTGSGCGKTTVTLALLRALTDRGLRAAPFKCGPDYIDPLFHSRAARAQSRNLDAFLCGRENIPRLLAKNGAGADIAVIEGVMGYYDGSRAEADENSAADIARLTGTPSVLVMDPGGMSLSAAALVKGFAELRENTIKSVILNGVSGSMTAYYRAVIERETGIRVLGALPKIPEASLESRHLGLVTAGEIGDLQRKTELLARAAAENIDLDALLALAGSAEEITGPERRPGRAVRVRLAAAEDLAFCFSYADSLDALRELGAEIAPFSPLSDSALPEGADGLLLCGGYPELYLGALSRNVSMLASVRAAVNGGLPTLAECGGFMYLHESIDGSPMAGVIAGEARMTEKLGRFGYFYLTAKADNLLCAAGGRIPAHEFHYSESTNAGADFALTKPSGEARGAAGHASGTLYAGYPHLNFAGCPDAARRFLQKCAEYGASR